jgi:hypothetical protein
MNQIRVVLVTKCEGVQLGLGHLDNNEDENK